MEELNHTAALEVFDEDGCDALTVVDMGDTISLAQVAEGGAFHDVVIGLKQAGRLRNFLNEVLRNVH